MKEKSRQKRLRLLAEAKKKPAVFTVYIVLRLIVVAILVSSILRGEYENAAICLLVLFLFLLPLFVQRNFGIELPGTLEIIILVFIFASEILGELGCFSSTYRTGIRSCIQRRASSARPSALR